MKKSFQTPKIHEQLTGHYYSSSDAIITSFRSLVDDDQCEEVHIWYHLLLLWADELSLVKTGREVRQIFHRK